MLEKEDFDAFQSEINRIGREPSKRGETDIGRKNIVKHRNSGKGNSDVCSRDFAPKYLLLYAYMAVKIDMDLLSLRQQVPVRRTHEVEVPTSSREKNTDQQVPSAEGPPLRRELAGQEGDVDLQRGRGTLFKEIKAQLDNCAFIPSNDEVVKRDDTLWYHTAIFCYYFDGYPARSRPERKKLDEAGRILWKKQLQEIRLAVNVADDSTAVNVSPNDRSDEVPPATRSGRRRGGRVESFSIARANGGGSWVGCEWEDLVDGLIMNAGDWFDMIRSMLDRKEDYIGSADEAPDEVSSQEAPEVEDGATAAPEMKSNRSADDDDDDIMPPLLTTDP